MLRFMLLVLMMFSFSHGVSAQEVESAVTAASAAPVIDVSNIDIDWVSKLSAYVVAIYLFLWAMGEVLTRISIVTKNTWDNKAAAVISQILWFIGSFAGSMGWKLPKAVILAEAEKIKAKEEKPTNGG